MDDQLSPLEARLERLEGLLRQLDDRVAALEGSPSRAPVAPPAIASAAVEPVGGPVQPIPAPAPAVAPRAARKRLAAGEDSDEPLPLALIGRTLIVLGGGYLLRALTDSHVLPVPAGIAAGLLYATVWLVLAWRAPHASATFHGIAAASIAFPLIWEGTAKFRFFSAEGAALALTVIAVIALIVAWGRSLQALAWIITLGATGASLMVMGSTSVVIPFIWTLSALALATLWLGYDRRWHLLRWPVAGVLDVVVAGLTFYVATQGRSDMAMGTMVAQLLFFTVFVATFCVRTLIRDRDVAAFEILQSGAVLVIGFGGAVWLAQSNAPVRSVLILSGLLNGAACYAVAYAFTRRLVHSSRNFVFYSSLGLTLTMLSSGVALHASYAAALWSVLAVAAAMVSARLRRRTLAIHATVYLIAASVASGLLLYGGYALLVSPNSAWPPLTVSCAVALGAAALVSAVKFPRQSTGRSRTAKIVVFFLLLWGLAGLAVNLPVTVAFGGSGAAADPGVVATIRTAVISLAAVVLALVSSRYTIARLFVYPVLIAGATKMTFEDFRVGRPSTLFIGLAIYGGSLVLAPRLRRRKSKSSGEEPHELQDDHRAIPDQVRRDDQVHHA